MKQKYPLQKAQSLITTFTLIFSGLITSPLSHANEFPEPVYVSLKHAGKIAKFNSPSKWTGGPNMLYEAITPDGKRLLVTSPSKQSVFVFNTATGKLIKIIKVGKAPKGIKISPNGKEAYVSNEGENTISIIDLTTYNVSAKIPTAKMPHNVRFNNSGTIAYVTLQGGAGLGVIDTKLKRVVKVIPTPGLVGPHNLDLSKNEKTAFVRDTVNSVAVVDLVKGNVIKLIKVGFGHSGIDVSPDGKYVFTGGIAGNTVTVIDSKTYIVIKSIKVGKGPHGLRASKNSRWLYISVTSGNSLIVIDTKTLKVHSTLKLSGFPFWIAVNGNP